MSEELNSTLVVLIFATLSASVVFFFSSRRRHTRSLCDWSSDVCSSDLLIPACAEAHREELGLNPLDRDPESFRWRTRMQIEDGRSWLWSEDGLILFKAEASAWTPSAVQLQQVWVDPRMRGRGYAQRGMRDLCRLLLERVPTVCLFVRAENAPAIRVYENVGMRQTISYRSLVFI